jgi:tetratricopeptide (TPR) repeat protein
MEIISTSDIYYLRGNAKAKLKDYKGSILDYSKELESFKDNANCYLNRGISQFNLGNKEAACLDWSKAGELGEEKAYDLIKEYCN